MVNIGVCQGGLHLRPNDFPLFPEFTVFALFYFVFEGNFPSASPFGVYLWRGNLTEGFLRYWIGDLILLEGLLRGGAYFRNFTVN